MKKAVNHVEPVSEFDCYKEYLRTLATKANQGDKKAVHHLVRNAIRWYEAEKSSDSNSARKRATLQLTNIKKPQ